MSDDAAIESLDRVARGHFQHEGFTPRLIACRFHTITRTLALGRILDVGCADGLLTAHLGSSYEHVVGVDGSQERIARAVKETRHLENVELRRLLFDDLRPRGGERFDGVILSCVLEHVDDPQRLLRQMTGFLNERGVIIAIVPNAESLHRRAGVLMGLLEGAKDHGEKDQELEHHTMYTLDDLIAEFERSGLNVTASGGHLIKPLPNAEMARLDPALVDAYEELGRELPRLAAEIFVAGCR